MTMFKAERIGCTFNMMVDAVGGIGLNWQSEWIHSSIISDLENFMKLNFKSHKIIIQDHPGSTNKSFKKLYIQFYDVSEEAYFTLLSTNGFKI